MRCGSVERILLRLQLWQLSPADVSRDVRSESRYPSSRWSVNGYIALIADEMSRFGVVDHYAVELQVTVCVTLNSVRKVTCCRFQVVQERAVKTPFDMLEILAGCSALQRGPSKFLGKDLTKACSTSVRTRRFFGVKLGRPESQESKLRRSIERL